jgi:hypothetical protein
MGTGQPFKNRTYLSGFQIVTNLDRFEYEESNKNVFLLYKTFQASGPFKNNW